MNYFRVLISLLVLALVAVGCKKEQPKPATPSEERTPRAPAPPSVPEAPKLPAAPSAEAVEQAKAKLAAVQAAIREGKLDQADADLKALEAMKDLPPDLQSQIQQARMALDAAQMAKANAETESLLTKILAMIKEGKLEDAEKALAPLEANKGSFPQALQDRITSARKALDAAKALQKTALPKLPG